MATALDPHCDPARLAAIGAHVRGCLARVPQAVRHESDAADLYVIDGFLDRADCREIVRIINSKAVPSTLYKGFDSKELRTSWTHHFPVGNPYTSDLEHYICETTGLDILTAEPMQGQRYRTGQQFRHHHDFFHTGDAYWQEEAGRGGQRSWTAMINLNAPRGGGETDFAHLGLKLAPKPGRMIVWDNMDRDGRPNMKTLHAGLPVTAGVKHVITLWFRQEPWRLINS